MKFMIIKQEIYYKDKSIYYNDNSISEAQILMNDNIGTQKRMYRKIYEVFSKTEESSS